jgi:hypothetical protein
MCTVGALAAVAVSVAVADSAAAVADSAAAVAVAVPAVVPLVAEWDNEANAVCGLAMDLRCKVGDTFD